MTIFLIVSRTDLLAKPARVALQSMEGAGGCTLAILNLIDSRRGWIFDRAMSRATVSPTAAIVSVVLCASGIFILLAGLVEHEHAGRVVVALVLCMPAIYYALRGHVRFRRFKR